MMARLLSWLLGFVLLAGCAAGAHQPTVSAAATPQLAIVGINLIPMTEGAAILADRTVLIRDGVISSVGPRRSVAIPRGTRIVDGRNRYLMPGLVDAHVHLEYIENPAVLNLFVANGVTTVRSMDGRPFILSWREGARSGAMVGPRIVTAGPIIDGAPPAREDNLAVADAAAVRTAIADQTARGYDFIKLYTNLSPDAYAAAIAEARQRGLRVAGHVPRNVPLETVIGSQWSIEHLGDFAGAVAAQGGAPTPGWARRSLAAPLDRTRLEALARRLAEAGVWIVPTAVQQDRWLAPPADVERWLAEPAIRNLPASIVDQWRGSLQRFSQRLDTQDWALLERARTNRLAVIGALHRAGVRLAIGSDTPNPFVAMGASVHLELANFVAAGLSPQEALRAATIAPARMLGLEREQGTIEVGKRADLLLLAGNPLEDVSHAARPLGLALAGRWFTAEELEALPRALGNLGQ
jgi:imidazolonepropionase-like amidohydrolase